METLIEILVEIVLEGAQEAVGARKLPYPVRVFAAVLLLIFSVGVIGFIVFLAVKTKSRVVAGIAVFLLVMFVVAAAKKYRELRG